MNENGYPKLDAMCRLCLKENAGTVCIFNSEVNFGKSVPISIPMRIMSCLSLEMQCSDGFPKKICTDCRFQLEKSYYFRKQSMASDAKIRKHLRLIGMGKKSKVFNNRLEEDDYDELELQDSFNFIREQEDLQKQVQKSKIDSIINEMKLQNEKDLEKIKESCYETCRVELIPEIREELRKELQDEIEENIRKEITEQCMRQAKESLCAELREECRQSEIKCLLDDLQTYLTNKNKSLDTSAPSKPNVLERPISPVIGKEPPAKIKIIPENLAKIEVVHMEFEMHNPVAEKGNILNENGSEYDQNTNGEECDSEGNFLMYDTQESFDIHKKSFEDEREYEDNAVQKEEYEGTEFVEDNVETYDKIIDDDVKTNEECADTTSTTSYRIEDNEDGEIKFLKKCSNEDINGAIDPDQKYEYRNIVIMNVDEGIENEYVEHFEEQEHVKNEKKPSNKTKTSPNKTKTSPNKKAKTSMVARTTSLTSETTFLTKTYINPMQRYSDTPKMFKCEECPMVFSTKTSLERHLRSHRKVEKTGVIFQCPECHIVVSCGSALRRHMYVHYDQKPFACNVCNKAFVQKEILKRHMQTHTGIRPHQCPHCHRSFAQRINLNQHINRNHLEEPRIQQHSCCLCPKRFNHASGLSRHMTSHSGVAFQCSECDRTFGDRSSIKRHIANMHGDDRRAKNQ